MPLQLCPRSPLAALYAFYQEHARCGELEGGLEGEFVWMRCECGVPPDSPDTCYHSIASGYSRP